MCHSSLVGRCVNFRLLQQNGFISLQKKTVAKTVTLKNNIFLSPSVKNSAIQRFKSGFIKQSFEVPLCTLQPLHNIGLFQTYRSFSDNKNQPSPSPAEVNLINTLKENFPAATDIAVVDISGGCGSMYEVFVESPDFKGMRLVKQHKMVTEALKGAIKDMHGIRISTAASS